MDKTRALVVAGAVIFALTGCVGGGASGGTASPGGNTPQPTSSTSAEPTATPSTPATDAAGPGCPATPGVTYPDGASVAAIGDIDGDGLADKEWMSETPDFRYGITTASGATFSVRDELAGPATHSGWTATLGNGAIVSVLDDGRTANLYGIADCAFVTPVGVDGKPYTFDMQNLRGNGTGLGCSAAGGSTELGGYQVLTNADGSKSVQFTRVTVAPDGSTAVNGDTVTVASDVPSDDPLVALASRSTCLATTIVSTSGK